MTIDQSIGEIDGSQSLTLSGDGELILSGTDTYTGGTIISGGTLDFASGRALPSGLVTITGSGWLELGGRALAWEAAVVVGGLAGGGLERGKARFATPEPSALVCCWSPWQ